MSYYFSNLIKGLTALVTLPVVAVAGLITLGLGVVVILFGAVILLAAITGAWISIAISSLIGYNVDNFITVRK